MFKLRFLWIMFFAFLFGHQKRTGHLRFWVTPFDCDLNLHCNNGNYLKFMDLGRWDLITRQGLLQKIYRRGLRPVVVRAEVDFKKSLPPFSFFTLDTEYGKSRERSCTLIQKFHVGKSLAAVGVVTVVFTRNGRAVPISEFLDLLPEELRVQ